MAKDGENDEEEEGAHDEHNEQCEAPVAQAAYPTRGFERQRAAQVRRGGQDARVAYVEEATTLVEKGAHGEDEFLRLRASSAVTFAQGDGARARAVVERLARALHSGGGQREEGEVGEKEERASGVDGPESWHGATRRVRCRERKLLG